MKILIDMDGVLVNFWAGIVRAHKLEIDPYTLPQWRGHCGGYDVLGITPGEFWEPCNSNWWFQLDPYPHYREIVAACEREVGAENVCLLSSPSSNVGCPSGKLRWLDRHLPAYRRKVLIGPNKEFCAHAGAILIDDMQANCDKFIEHGGRAILWPGPWNANAHIEDGDKMVYLEAQFGGVEFAAPEV